MSLYETITSDIKTAMKAGDRTRLDVLRFALSGLNNFLKEKQIKEAGATMTDEEVVSVLQKDVKRRKDSIELFRQGNRQDLVEKEEAEMAYIQAYLPKELSREELEKMVSDVIAAGAADFNAVMKETMKFVKGRADGKTVGDVIKAKLG
jgi:uncharacterized protein YqeY